MSKPLTVADLYSLCKRAMEHGYGDKTVMISNDDEGNGFHYLWYEFSTVEQAGAERDVVERIASAENTIILG